MYKRGHQAVGSVLGLAYANLAGLTPTQSAMTVAATVACSYGGLSPDVDQLINGSGVWAHRRITHYWKAVLVVWTVLAPSLMLPVYVVWPDSSEELLPVAINLWASIGLGWFGHLLGDWAFGRRVHGADGPGIPIKGPSRGYKGLGVFRSGGDTERVFTVCILWPLAAALAAMLLN